MSDAGSDPIDFREIDARENPTRFGRGHRGGDSPPGSPSSGSYGRPGSNGPARLSPGNGEWGAEEAGGAGFSAPGRFSVNPFIVALWVLVAGLILAAFGAFTIAQETLNTPIPAESPQLGYMWMSFAPFLLFAGLLGLLGLLLWHATQWRRTREQQPPPW
ncbi:hypothetical protein [Arthrobacter sp. ISL-28]|uniref:hypothetical protein n=1 Tax=Arthrobacter sp. ISL-28 TaxID=2819108 RepID=UPI001BEC7257|nr:hypothetical protein [Arthrobacter sp. ISL-28]MBT2520323.1 hypothetical protein [Arthrobacter sp. ISL-28]